MRLRPECLHGCSSAWEQPGGLPPAIRSRSTNTQFDEIPWPASAAAVGADFIGPLSRESVCMALRRFLAGIMSETGEPLDLAPTATDFSPCSRTAGSARSGDSGLDPRIHRDRPGSYRWEADNCVDPGTLAITEDGKVTCGGWMGTGNLAVRASC